MLENELEYSISSAVMEKIVSSGAPKLTQIQEQASVADSLLRQKAYSKVIPLLIDLTDNYDIIVNLIEAGIRPWSSASYEAQSMSSTIVKELDAFQKLLNEYIRKRDETAVAIGECYIALNRYADAIKFFSMALKTISIDDKALWSRAANGIFQKVGLPNLSLQLRQSSDFYVFQVGEELAFHLVVVFTRNIVRNQLKEVITIAKVTTYVFQCTKCGIVKNYRTRVFHDHCGIPMTLINALVTDEKDAPPVSCYITTATCRALNKGDYCEELQTFRAFRDTYMKKDNNLESEVKEYYKIAPMIVDAIDALENNDNIYIKIYNDYLAPAYEKIRNGSNRDAYTLYKNMVRELTLLYVPEYVTLTKM